MTRPSHDPLETLAKLDRDLVHLFVAGPGYGEGVAVALPGRGWILVDGCLVDEDRSPLLAILDRWRTDEDPIELLALTHPHKDHALGFRTVLEETEPAYVLLSAPATRPLDGLSIAGHPYDAPTTSERLKRSALADACAAIRRYHDRHPERLLGVSEGTAISISTPGVIVTARAPSAARVATAASQAMAGTLPGNPNELSLVLEIEHGGTRIVLGSDLVEPGWREALATRPELADHHGLKVPHHGSPTAHNGTLMGAREGRAWVVAPFSPNRLPVHAEGLPWLVARCGQLYLTAAPLARNRQPLPPAQVSLDQLPALFATGAPPGRGAAAISPPRGLQPLDAVWGVAFDTQGCVKGAWRGPRAFGVVAATSSDGNGGTA